MMTTETTWIDANQHYLTSALGRLRRLLEHYLARANGSDRPETEVAGPLAEAIVDTLLTPPALARLRVLFGLSPFETDIMMLCAGVEFDASFARLLAAAQGEPVRAYPTFSLALAALPDAHWSALRPDGPLRHWHLIDIERGLTLTTSPLRIDERVLHELAGVPHLDARLAGMVELCPPAPALVPSQQALAEQAAHAWIAVPEDHASPIIQLCGPDGADLLVVATAASDSAGLRLHRLDASLLPTSPVDLDTFARLWEREAILSASALLIDCGDLDLHEPRSSAVGWLVERMHVPVLVATHVRRSFRSRRVLSHDVGRPSRDEQRGLWQAVFGSIPGAANGHIDALVDQFDLSQAVIRSAGSEVLGVRSQLDSNEQDNVFEIDRLVWDASRRHARPRLDDLAQRIEPAATWDDLVMAEHQRFTLQQIALHVRHRVTVYERWGFSSKGRRGLGISALFAGASGTGKTTAAEVLANELRLDLYRIDLSAMVSKYIGETEKNLRRVFDAAEQGGAILLFDEADALFGKRSEVKDSHDRYANIEVSYLLQRMELYRGLAILTSNMKHALDPAFIRRIRFIVNFPFPDAEQRAEIWRRIFPTATPAEQLDYARLAQLNITGGNIRNIALNAAFLAAADGEPVRMEHVLQAARGEYAKIEKAMTEAEFGGWD